jgi:D-aspartate ligase
VRLADESAGASHSAPCHICGAVATRLISGKSFLVLMGTTQPNMRATLATDSNPEKAEPDWPAAVIAGAFQTGVLAARRLTQRRVRALCIDCDETMTGFRSASVRTRKCPEPETSPDEWLQFMLDLAGELGGTPVLIPSADQFVSAIAAHATVLGQRYLLNPGAGLQGQLALKDTQYRLAFEHGMPMPRTAVVTSLDEVLAFSSVAHFPTVLKPLHFREWQRFPVGHPLSHAKIALANGPEELVHHWRQASEISPSIVLQEVIQGSDAAKRIYLSCYDHDGRRIGWATLRELRCHPVEFGPASVTEPIGDAETNQICDRFLRAIGYSGICEIEMKRDRRDGQLKLIEVNPRLSGSGDAAPYAGVDLCWLHYLDLSGQRVQSLEPAATDFRHVVLRVDIKTVTDYRRAGLISWREVIQSYRPPLAFFDFDLRDWRQAIETMLIVLRDVARGVAAAWRRPLTPTGSRK